ncbi:MAG: flagellar hook-associated protein FlgK [Planctomycetes bacterium]|nr:flagellar hook-associated protein FlgK [Planctomycetota bacterium]
MSLMTSLNVGLTAIQAQQAALQTDGHNIANANTPGYTRQRPDLVTMLPQDLVFAQIGKGVRLARIQRLVDQTLVTRLQDAASQLGSLQVSANFLDRAEAIFNELSGTDLSSGLDQFFRALEELAQRPEDTSTRNDVLAQGATLARMFQDLGTKIRDTREDVNREIIADSRNINSFAQQIADLNDEIVVQENGGIDFDAANDLRDRRDLLVQQLSEIVDVRVIENAQGMANVLVGSNYLVFEKTAYEVTSVDDTNRNITVSTPQFAAGGINLEIRNGRLRGLIDSRDEVLGTLGDRLNILARAVMFEVNQIHSTGEGLTRFTDLTSVNGLAGPSLNRLPVGTDGRVTGVPTTTSVRDFSLTTYPEDYFNGLDVLMTSGPNSGQHRRVVDFFAATGTLIFDREFDNPVSPGDTFQVTGLPYAVRNGSFDLKVTNEVTGVERTFNITVDLDKLPAPPVSEPRDSTLESIVAEITAEVTAAAGGVPEISASITNTNRLRITSSDTNLRFSFANDSSHFLAAIGMNTFFAGEDAATMKLNPLLEARPDLVAAARSNTAGDNSNALALAQLREATVLEEGTATIEGFYQGVVGELAIDTREGKDRLKNQETLSEQLHHARERVSGVNLDEETVNMITHQRAFQAAARYIAIIDNLLDTLINRT